ncbi:hypothetical protein NLG97_g9243 [Lecanicillium saksenae]|uniref:Uncharacterized protein n=1 Tax=Lecanicillium saksenae TaxID=468837 RepID=A0ACC1QGJ5_9HYPO|nr:hypothetical protein NLG97_g9243 [Lecanicillium saksenae]
MNAYIATLMAFTGLAAAEAQFKVCRDANFGGCGLMFANIGWCTTIGSPIANMISSVDSLGHDCTIYYLRAGGCDICRWDICAAHVHSPAHSMHGQYGPFRGNSSKLISAHEYQDQQMYGMLQEQAEGKALKEQTNDAAVCQLASRLNGNKSCSVEHRKAGDPEIGTKTKYHARVRFHDGSPSWLLQVPRLTSFIRRPLTLIDYLIRSEYATLKFLEGTSAPAPRVFAYGVTGHDHGVGVSFLLTEELPGSPWNRSAATEHDENKIWNNLASILAELEKYPFSQAGSLMLHGDNFQLSAVASDAFLVLDPRGPFSNSNAYYAAFANQHLELIADRQIYAGYPVEAYLVYRFLKDSIAQLVPRGGGDAPEQFFLKLADDRNDNLLVDANLNITGIMDWHMARVVPRREAFGQSLITADASKPSRDQASVSTDGMAMGSAMRWWGIVHRLETLERPSVMDERMRRFFWGLAIQPTWADALPLAEAILKEFGVGMPWEEWKKAALEKYKDDKRLQELIAQAT